MVANNLPLVGGLCLVQRTSTTQGLKNLPLVGGLCLVQRTSTTEGLKNLPLVGGLCLVQRTSTKRGLRNCPSLEDFVSCNRLRPGRASRSAPHWRTLSRERNLAKTDRARTTKQDKPKRTMPMPQTKRLGKRKEKLCGIYLAKVEDFA